jgi:hypothetical protein
MAGTIFQDSKLPLVVWFRAMSHEHLDAYLNEFAFRFNRRASKSRGKLFYRLAQQAVQIQPAPFNTLIKHKGQGVVESGKYPCSSMCFFNSYVIGTTAGRNGPWPA